LGLRTGREEDVGSFTCPWTVRTSFTELPLSISFNEAMKTSVLQSPSHTRDLHRGPWVFSPAVTPTREKLLLPH